MITLGVLFLGFSHYLFIKTVLAPWIYAFIGIIWINSFDTRNRTELLKTILSKMDFIQIRMMENIGAALPFGFFLGFKGEYLVISVLISTAIILSLINQNRTNTFYLPTPFFNWPFEFITGFRRSLFLLLIFGIILFQAIRVDNYNLGLFALILTMLLSLSFYTTPESEFFVWIFNTSGKRFLKRKIIAGSICISILTLPVLGLLGIFFIEQIWITLAVFTLGCIVLWTMILAKYSAFPNEMNLPQGIIFALCIWFPPMLFIAIPLFYRQSRTQLKRILE